MTCGGHREESGVRRLCGVPEFSIHMGNHGYRDIRCVPGHWLCKEKPEHELNCQVPFIFIYVFPTCMRVSSCSDLRASCWDP